MVFLYLHTTGTQTATPSSSQGCCRMPWGCSGLLCTNNAAPKEADKPKTSPEPQKMQHNMCGDHSKEVCVRHHPSRLGAGTEQPARR